MMKLYFAPRTRAVRIVWLLEELGLPYELERVEFRATTDRFFQQATPTGKLPTLEDGNIVMCESGAITEYVVETYGDGRLSPAVGTPERAAYLQWIHFAESTAFPPIGVLVWLTLYRDRPEDLGGFIKDVEARVANGLYYLETALDGKTFLLGEAFTAADVMMGFTVNVAHMLGQLDDRYPNLAAYLGRLQDRPAFQKAASMT